VLTNGNVDDDSIKAQIISQDRIGKNFVCQNLIIDAMKQYGYALTLSQKHVFQALPRLLTLWFEFTEIENRVDDDINSRIEENISLANEKMAELVKKIQPISYYSVLPQLISRIGRNESDTIAVLSAIIRRVLSKFPAQAMWHLGWLRQSSHKVRQKRSEEIFKSVQKTFRNNKLMKHHDMLDASKDLYKFLIELAKYQPKKENQSVFNVRQWEGKVELKEFMPPVQAALSVSRNAVGTKDSNESFPKHVPRMRSFSTQVHMMSSKARPKKLTAFAVPEGYRGAKVGDSQKPNRPMKSDIGEMHFLVKCEARGDLRKDARVQDLNNVINRILAKSCTGNVGKRHHRRLQLRTFSVVCLSEDCGILEW
jgi:serine/threonine-protein kinase ATR